MKSNIRRKKNLMGCRGVIFFAAKKARGKATKAAPNVPKKAIKIVSPIAQATSECLHILLYQKSLIIFGSSPLNASEANSDILFP